MSTQRPFFGNFLAAFRAHSAMQKAAASTQQTTQQASRTYTTTSTSTTTSALSSATSRPTAKASQPASTPTTSTTATTATATKPFHAANRQQHTSTSPYSRSPASPASPGTTTGFINRGSSKRRGSDSSTEGFRDVVGEQKWYIGGRTAAGEERFYKLGVVKRARSIDRLSLDRMSL